MSGSMATILDKKSKTRKMQETSSDWYAHGGLKAAAPSPAYEHQFGNPDTKHGKPGADTKAEALIRQYIPGYSGHTPAQLDKIGGGAWKPNSPYGLGDQPVLVDADGNPVPMNFSQGTDWDPDGDGRP